MGGDIEALGAPVRAWWAAAALLVGGGRNATYTVATVISSARGVQTGGRGNVQAGGWRGHIGELEPTVLIIGGFFTSPPQYGPMRHRLLQRGAAGVVVAPIWLPDWILSELVGLGPSVRRAARALRVAREASAASEASRGAPILVVGHSFGGLVARLLTVDVPVGGHRHAAAPSIGAIVTLGTPHRLYPGTSRVRYRVASSATDLADAHAPGAAYAPHVGYLSVASRRVMGRPDGTLRERAAFILQRRILADPEARTDEGDGWVPVRSAPLHGAQPLVLDDVVHGQDGFAAWYGSETGLDGWWDSARTVWRAALQARADACASGSSFVR